LKKKRSWVRIAFAFYLTPVIAAISYSLLGFNLKQPPVFLFFTLLFSILVACITTFLIAVPGFLILKRFKRCNIYTYSLLCGGAGILVMTALKFRMPLGESIGSLVRGGVSGILAGLVFWYLAFYTRKKKRDQK
jgi:hypothetical protein